MDVFEYSGGLFVCWARSQCVSCPAGVQRVCHNTLVHQAWLSVLPVLFVSECSELYIFNKE